LPQQLIEEIGCDHIWAARLSSVEDGDSIGNIEMLAWARIIGGERPWDGLTIRRSEARPVVTRFGFDEATAL